MPSQVRTYTIYNLQLTIYNLHFQLGTATTRLEHSCLVKSALMPFTRCCYQHQFSRICLMLATTIMVSLFCEKVPLSFQPWQQIGNWAHPCLALLNFHFFPIWPVISVKTQFLRHLVPGTLTVQSTLWVWKEKACTQEIVKRNWVELKN